MKKEIEVEYKSVITVDKYQELLGLMPQFAEKKETYEQINYFFDTADQLLDRHGVTLRLRYKKGTWQLTAKLKQKTEGEYVLNQELNDTISEESAKNYLENGLDTTKTVITEMLRLSHIQASVDFQLLGHLTTLRTDFSFYEDTISLDQNEYNGQLDYELEWESTNHAFIEFINRRILHLDFNNASGKRKRFLKSIAS